MKFFKKHDFTIRPIFERLKNLKGKSSVNWKKIILWSFLGITFTLFFLLIIFFLYCINDPIVKDFVRILNKDQKIDRIQDFTFAENTIIYDKTGKNVLYSVYGNENRRVVPLNDISQNFISAILAAEDDRFFYHPGLSLGGMAKALCFETSRIVGFSTFGGICPPRGGSTLTNQLIDNIMPPEKPGKWNRYVRKTKEWYLSWKIENRENMSKQEIKEEILELYANKISFGAMNGVETASQTFFNKSAKDLTIAESAILASVVKMPTFYSPWGNHPFVEITVSEEEIEKLKLESREAILALPGITVVDGLRGKTFELYEGKQVYFSGRSDWVLERMHSLSFINDNEYEKAKEELQQIVFERIRTDIKAPHFVFYVREFLEKKFGKEIVEQGGLQVITTLDLELQEKAENIIAEVAQNNEKNYNAKNAALLASENSTGHIITMVGSRNFWDTENDGNVNVILQKRLPGSAYKPIVYATAFLNGLAPASVLFDVKTDFGNNWVPSNFDGTFSGPVAIRKALGHSLNIPAVKACFIAGASKVVELSNKIGVTLDRDADFYGNAIALGAGEVRAIDMSQGFSVFANGGKSIPLTPILIVKDRNGNILMDNTNPPEEPEQVLDEEVAFLITDVLSDSEARGPGWNANLQLPGRKNAVKTGTSNKRINNVTWPFDAWTIGYTPQYTTVVWVGNNDGSVLNHHGSGFTAASPIWKRFMTTLHENLPVENFKMPEGIKIIPVSRFSGKLPLPNTDEKLIVKEKFASFALPKESDSSLRIIEVDKISNRLPNDFTPVECLEKKAVLNFHSYYPDKPNWENPVKQWVEQKGREFVSAFGVDKLTDKAPEGIDNVHNQENFSKKPTVIISSPVNFGIVTPPYIDINPQISAPNRLSKVQFFWNGEMVKEISAPNTRTSISISPDLKNGTTHEIRVVALDNLCYSGSATISVKIGIDDSPPNAEIIFPIENAELEVDSIYTFLVNAFDEKSAVDRVDFILNNRTIGISKERPYSILYKTTNTGEHNLKVKAYDTAGNVAEISRNFTVKTSSINQDVFEVLSPKNNSSFKKDEMIDVSVVITQEMADSFKSLTIFTQTKSGKRITVADFNENQLTASRVFNTAFNQLDEEYEIYAKVNFAEHSFFSKRIKVFSN